MRRTGNPGLSRNVLVLLLLASGTGLAGCGDGNFSMDHSISTGSDSSGTGSSDMTARASYAAFVTQMDEILAVTGVTDGWTSNTGQPWAPDAGIVMEPWACDPANPENSPRQIEFQVLGPAAGNPEADRDAVVRYMEERGMKVSGVYGGAPESGADVPWTAYGKGENGMEIAYASSLMRRGLSLAGECSSHPSMQDVVSRSEP